MPIPADPPRVRRPSCDKCGAPVCYDGVCEDCTDTVVGPSGHTLNNYAVLFDRYRAQYPDGHEATSEEVREWWQFGTKPLNAARFHANGIEPWNEQHTDQ